MEKLVRSRADLVATVARGDFKEDDGEFAAVRLNGQEYKGRLRVEDYRGTDIEVSIHTREGIFLLYSPQYNNLTLHTFECMRVLV